MEPPRPPIAPGADPVEPEPSAPSRGPAPSLRPSRLGVLRHRHFRNVWLAAMGSSVGGWMESVGVQWLFAQATGSALALGVLAMAQFGPMLVLGLVAGVVVDLVSRKNMLLVTQAVMMAIAGLLALASYGGWATPGVLIALSLGHGIALAFNIPAWQVLTPRLVPRDELTRAIALNGLQFNLARAIGPALAGALMASHGATVLFVVNTLSFVGVLAAVARTPPSPRPARDGRRPTALMREAFAFVFTRRGPRAVFIGLVVFSMFAAPLLRMLPLMVADVYHAREATYGFMLALMGAGATSGVFALRLIPRWYPKHHLIPISITASGACIAIFGSTSSIAIAGAAIFLGGVFWLWAFNTGFAAIQLLVPDQMRGRVMAICNVAIFGAMPLGSLVAGAIGDAFAGSANPGLAAQIGIGLCGVILACAGLAMLIWRTPEVDGIGPGDPGYTPRPGLVAGLTARAHRVPHGTRSG